MLLFYIFAVLLLLQSLIALRDGFSYLNYVTNYAKQPFAEFTPSVAIFAPCKGIDDGMDNFLHSLFQLDYPNYQILFALESANDLASTKIAQFLKLYPKVDAQLVVAGQSVDCGQKVHNLLTAINKVADKVAVFAFVDSDISLPVHWLRDLVVPLQDQEVGATTGYRWFIPEKGYWAAVLRGAWNGSTATALGGHKRNFAWGGSMAILKETFYKIDVPKFWQGSVSDDYGLTRAIQAAKLYIKFVPKCLVPSRGDCSWAELLEFTTRQIIITRVYANGLWKLLLVSHLLFNIVFFGGLIIGVAALLTSRAILPLSLIVSIYLLGAWKGYLRVQAICLMLQSEAQAIKRHKLAYYFCAPLVSVIFLYNVLASAYTRSINWRGIVYKLESPNNLIILSRNNKYFDITSKSLNE